MTRRLHNRPALVALVLALALLGAGAAWSYWLAPGSGAASARVATLAPPSGVEASSPAGSSSVSVSWTAPAAGGVAPSGYYVRRWSGGEAALAGGGCGSPGSPVAATSCTDAGVPDGTYTYTVVAVYRSWSAASSHSGAVTVLHDSTPPSTSLATKPGTPDGSGGWFRQTSVSFTLGATDAGTGVAATFYSIDGGAMHTYSAAVAISSEGDHTVEYWSADNAGNVETRHAAHVKLDSGAPAGAVSLGETPVHAYLAGATLYFGGSLGGSFTLLDTVSDAVSGPASATFPLLAASHWTHASQVVTSPGGGPFASSSYSWTPGAATPAAGETTVSSSDAAGNAGAAALTFTDDSTAPGGGALTVNGTLATSAGSTSAAATTGFAINARTDFAEAQSASQSGLRSSTLTVQSAPLAKNACGAPGSGGAYTSATVISGTSNPAITGGYCYRYTLTGTDNVGNAASVSTTVKVDTTAPSAPTVQLSGATGSTFVSGTTAYINAQAGRSGSFLATASAADGESGIATIALPSLSGFTSGGGSLGSPFETTYSWSGAVAASGLQSATATNGAGLAATNASAFTVTPDTTAPSGGSVSVPARSRTTSVSVTFGGGTDGGSGVNSGSGELLRAEATYTATSDSCGTFGSFSKVGSAEPASPATDATVASGKCYAYEYKISDNVGNAATYGPSEALKVNTSGPSLIGISSTNGNATIESGDTLTLTFSDELNASSIPTSGKIVQKKTGGGAQATESITGITSGSEGWSTGVTSGYQEKSTEAEFNETASVAGNTVKVTVGSKVKGSGTIAGATGTVTGAVNASVKDVFENAASAGTFSISAKFW